MAVALEPLAVLAGARTPFAKAFTALAQVPADQLGRIALLGALQKAGLTPAEVGEVVFGNVGGQPDASNLGRVIALRAGVPPRPGGAYGQSQLCLRYGSDHRGLAYLVRRAGRVSRGRRHGVDEQHSVSLEPPG